MSPCRNASLFALTIVLALCTPAARADFHLWGFNEVFSDSTGKIQFIEFKDTLENGEEFLSGQVLSSGQGSITFSKNLPSDQTLNKTFIVATNAFADLPGAPQPDYTIPENFFNPSGDSFNYAGVATFTFGPGELPTDGESSLNADRTTSVNSPTNFEGETGSVRAGGPSGIPLPPAAIPGAIMIGLSALGAPAFKQRVLKVPGEVGRSHEG